MKTALVVDDQEITRRCISKMLMKFGYTSIEAADGEQALQALDANKSVEIAFVDWNMPVMTGIEFLRQVRSDPCTKSLRIVMVTGNSDMEFIDSALKEGVDEYIMLPLTNEVLEEKLALIGIYPIVP